MLEASITIGIRTLLLHVIVRVGIGSNEGSVVGNLHL